MDSPWWRQAAEGCQTTFTLDIGCLSGDKRTVVRYARKQKSRVDEGGIQMLRRHLYDVSWYAMLGAAALPSIASAHQGQREIAHPPAADEASGVGDIVVTAQRRNQRLVDVPISVTVATEEQLSRAAITTSNDLVLVTPGLRMEMNGPWVEPSIRGITSTAVTPGSEQNVAMYIDGVYQPNAQASSFSLADVKSIETLKGPQGTLFGRNATGGAILVNTLAPSFTPTGKISASYGRFHDATIQGYISAPLASDKLAFSVSASHVSSGRWLTNLLASPYGSNKAGRINDDLVRAKLLWKPSESVEVALTGFYSERSDDVVNAWTVLNGNTALRQFGILTGTHPYETAAEFSNEIITKSHGGSLVVSVDTSIGNIKSTTAITQFDMYLQTDGDASPASIQEFVIHLPNRSISQEVLLNSDAIDRVHLVAGAFGYFAKAGYGPPPLEVISGNQIVFTNEWKTKTTSYAVFADATFQAADRLTLIGGLRYTHEQRTFNDLNPGANSSTRTATFNNVTPRASIRYELSPNANIYFTFSQGFKSGQWDRKSTGVAVPVNPEKITAYEVGFKTATSHWALSAASYYYKYSNLQNQLLDEFSQVYLVNAGSAKLYGGEVSLTAELTPEISISAQGAYMHGEYTDYRDAVILLPNTNSGGALIGGNTPVLRDLTGFTLKRTPSFTANLAVSYLKEFKGGTLNLSTNMYYTSSFGIEDSLRIKQPAYVQLNATASWRLKSGIEIGVYGRNLTERRVFLQTDLTPLGDFVGYQEPRNYGVKVSYDF